MAKLTKNQRRLLVIARLGGPSWWTHRNIESRSVYWYWDGKDSWFAYPPRFELHSSEITPEGMLRMKYFELVDDPRKR